jgi:diaminohydroxyphosphoribosylaminopyrimidine deaminase / 5-amino-6-(5-phosphoribosylamino)uracil reductase
MNSDDRFMFRCLELAEKGIGHTLSNPLVGAVITIKDENSPFGERIIGEGYHIRYGDAHAEVNAVNAVKDKSLLPQATLYVNLEPCSHFGKTPPCADLINQHKIARVVIGNVDPNPKVSGAGIEKLQAAGIIVKTGVFEKECEFLNRRFFTFHREKRPYVLLKWAQTVNGFLARQDFSSKWISNPYSRILVHKYRSEEMAVMVGTNTGLYDNPSLNVRDWFGKDPIRILVDKNLRIPKTHNLFDNSIPTLVLNELKSGVEGKNEFLKIDFNQNLASQILQKLYEKNIASVLIEGGTKLFHTFIEAGLWDEARIFVSPTFFEDGIKAPEIPAAITEKRQIDDNQVYTCFNSAGWH